MVASQCWTAAARRSPRQRKALVESLDSKVDRIVKKYNSKVHLVADTLMVASDLLDNPGPPTRATSLVGRWVTLSPNC